ncbi:MAG: EAL domain-containing protein [Clostridiales bacterium]|nr:EAL domain-containing protein [Clostridiales bacterium]
MEGFNREELLDYINNIPLSEMTSVLNDAVFCIFIINPWEKRILFSDGMKAIMGTQASEDMLLTAFYQFVPENIRPVVAAQYDAATGDLLDDKCEHTSFTHFLAKSQTELYRMNVELKVMPIGKNRFIVGTMSDCTEDIGQTAYNQLFGEGTDTYLFTFDSMEDVCYISNGFVEAFDLPDNRLPMFTRNYRSFILPEDEDKLAEAFRSFLDTGDDKRGTEVRFLAPGRGELHLRFDGFSDAGSDGKAGGNPRYVSGAFTDVTPYILMRHQYENILDGSGAVVFEADIKKSSIRFSPNIKDLFPQAPLEIDGDYVEILADYVVEEDRKRFRNAFHRLSADIGTDFAIEIRARSGNDKTFWIACRGKSYTDGITKSDLIVGTAFDLSRMNEVKESIEKKEACHKLTGLPTRDKLTSDAQRLIRNKDVLSAAIILADVKDFSAFNDRYGRSAGNEILLALADLLKIYSPKNAEVYHVGIDTFAILWPDATQKTVTDFMMNMYEYTVQPLETGQGSFFVTLGIAAAFYPQSSTVEELITHAEIALHKVKQDKKLKYSIFSPVDMHQLKERVDFEVQISQCIRNNMESFQLYYQPLIEASTGKLAGAEALLRWQTPQGELANPEKVVASLEATDQMGIVGSWILNEAAKQCAKWISKGAPKDFYVHINATADDLIKKDYAKEVMAVIDRYNLSPENILIELTETSFMKNMALCRKNLFELNSNNIRTALDDFGSGYSSFNYLKELPVNEIKIDKTFVDDMETVEFNRAFISAMTELAHSIGIGVVVEGVETESQAMAIKEMGADIFQGYYFGKPMSVFAFWNQYFS